MQVVVPEFAKKFACAAGDCPDTCCQGWEIIIDPETLAYYRQLEGAIGDAVRHAIVPEDEPYFGFSEKGTCALLDDSDLCRLQKEFGEQAQCRVCRTYPRFVRQYGALRETGVSLSCPEAVRLLLENPAPVRFLTEEQELPIEPNDLEPELFLALKQCRTLAYRLIQDRRYRFDERLYLLVCFASSVQYCLSCKAYARIERICARFSSPVGRSARLRELHRMQYHCGKRYQLLSHWTAFFSGLEILSPKWSSLLTQLQTFCKAAPAHSYYRAERQTFQAAFCSREYEYEHILLATIYKYWLEAADDGILLPKVQQAVVSVLLLRELNLMQWVKNGSYDTVETAHRIARELEHNEENLEAMRTAFLHTACFRIASIKKVI